MNNDEFLKVLNKKLEMAKDYMYRHDDAMLISIYSKRDSLTDEERLEIYQVQKAVLNQLLLEVDIKIIETKFAIKRKESN